MPPYRHPKTPPLQLVIAILFAVGVWAIWKSCTL